MEHKNSQIDKTDLAILRALTHDAATPYTDIAKQLDVSPGTIHVRMKKMIDIGIVKGSTLIIDHALLGYDITAFLGIYLEKSSMYKDAAKKLSEIPEVLSLHYTTGNYSIFLKMVCQDTEHLRKVLHDKIQKVPGIQRTETFISLEETLERASVQL